MVLIFLAAVLAMLWLLRRDRAPRGDARAGDAAARAPRRAGGVGYIQYFNDIPAFLVGVHIAGATAVWSATLMLFLGMYEHDARVHAATRARPTPLLAPA